MKGQWLIVQEKCVAIIVGRKNLKNEWWTSEVRAAGVRRINYDVSEKLFF